MSGQLPPRLSSVNGGDARTASERSLLLSLAAAILLLVVLPQFRRTREQAFQD